ncbi:hypothetical protein BN1263280274 [Stenotrophomonas maltophilia]|nr:hypothetical protein BN1263280274 [Stenotrophomonas maltophilia]
MNAVFFTLPKQCHFREQKRLDDFTRLQCDHVSGRGDRIRTCDLYVPNVALYQTELHPEGAA